MLSARAEINAVTLSAQMERNDLAVVFMVCSLRRNLSPSLSLQNGRQKFQEILEHPVSARRLLSSRAKRGTSQLMTYFRFFCDLSPSVRSLTPKASGFVMTENGPAGNPHCHVDRSGDILDFRVGQE